MVSSGSILSYNSGGGLFLGGRGGGAGGAHKIAETEHHNEGVNDVDMQ